MLDRRSTTAWTGVGIALALLMVACGGGSASRNTSPRPSRQGLSPKDYVAGVCGAAATWETAIQTETSQFEAQSKSASSLDEGKTIFVAYVDQVVKDTDTMVTVIDGLEPPAVANGEQIRAAVASALQKVKSAFQDADAKAQQIDTNSTTAYVNGLTAIGTDIESTLSGLGDPLANLPNAELEQAAKADPNCQKLESSG
jgi:hypothetical protein